MPHRHTARATRIVPHEYVALDLATIAPGQLDVAIERSGEYLRSQCQPSGQFTYRSHLDPSYQQARSRYNLLRHAGAIYALGMYHRWKPDGRVADTMKQAGMFLKANVAPIQDQPHTLAVWSLPEVSGSEGAAECKLGGTGLGLIALLSIEQIEGGFNSQNELEQLGAFILFMQKSDGSFYSKYLPSKGGRDDSWVSLYYPGEAALGLLMLYDHTGDKRWLDGAVRALEFLAESRIGAASIPADHWSLLATEKLLHEVPDAVKIDRPQLERHAADICRAILAEQVDDETVVAGGFAPDGRTTPTATRLEGLIAALSFLSGQQWEGLRAEIRAAVERGLSFLIASQVTTGAKAGAVPRAIGVYETPSTALERTFNRRAGEVRIDYVQHFLSALIAFREE